MIAIMAAAAITAATVGGASNGPGDLHSGGRPWVGSGELALQRDAGSHPGGQAATLRELRGQDHGTGLDPGPGGLLPGTLGPLDARSDFRPLIPAPAPTPPPAPAPSGDAPVPELPAPDPPPVSAHLASIRECESGGDYTAYNPAGPYYGAYQFDQQTWESVGGTGNPGAASPAEQDRRAAMLYAQRGPQPWPVCGYR